jgi:hypothetical protein
MSWERFLPNRNPAYLAAAVIVCWGLLSIGFGERLPRNDGFGWDGMEYLSITKGLWQPNDAVWMYHGKRCLPCVVIHYTLKALRLPVEGPYIFQAFRLYNLLLSVVVLFTLLAVCRELGVGIRGQWLACVGFCCNYFCLKQYYYSPILTDLWALAFSCLALLSYFRGQRFRLVGWTFLGSFTWGITPYFGALLILFPYAKQGPPAASPAAERLARRLARPAAALAAVAVVCYTAYLIWGKHFYGSPGAHVSHRALPLSVACLGLFLYRAVRDLLDGPALTRWREVVSPGFLGRVATLAATFALLAACYRALAPYFTRPDMPASNFLRVFVESIFAWSVAKPLVFLLAQVVYYGPAIILLVLHWRQVAHQAQRLGTGVVLVLGLGLLMALSTEPRYFLVFFPLALVLLVKVLEGQPWGVGRQAALAALGVFMSKAWLPLNWGPWPQEFRYEDVFRFPMQAFFMNYGTFINTQTYLVQGACALAAALLIKYALLPRPAVSAPSPAALRRAA